MNKYEKAYSHLIDVICAYCGKGDCGTCLIRNDLNVLSELVDKSTPTEPSIVKGAVEATVCPHCGAWVERRIKIESPKVANAFAYPPLDYCHCCGQALDWSDENV